MGRTQSSGTRPSSRISGLSRSSETRSGLLTSNACSTSLVPVLVCLLPFHFSTHQRYSHASLLLCVVFRLRSAVVQGRYAILSSSLPVLCTLQLLAAGRRPSCPVLSCPVLSCPFLACPVLSCPATLATHRFSSGWRFAPAFHHTAAHSQRRQAKSSSHGCDVDEQTIVDNAIYRRLWAIGV